MLERGVTSTIERALHNLHFGYVQLVIHEGQLVRIERVERIRLPARAEQRAAGGLSAGHAATPSGLTDTSEATQDRLAD